MREIMALDIYWMISDFISSDALKRTSWLSYIWTATPCPSLSLPGLTHAAKHIMRLEPGNMYDYN